jgi:hypothetical protein
MKRAVITLTEYQRFQRAYDFFNRELFDGSLPQVLVTLQRHANTRGYFSPERFKGRVDRQTVHELALNPDNFTGRSDELILSTLTHEMVHVWQSGHGSHNALRGVYLWLKYDHVWRDYDDSYVYHLDSSSSLSDFNHGAAGADHPGLLSRA